MLKKYCDFLMMSCFLDSLFFWSFKLLILHLNKFLHSLLSTFRCGIFLLFFYILMFFSSLYECTCSMFLAPSFSIILKLVCLFSGLQCTRPTSGNLSCLPHGDPVSQDYGLSLACRSWSVIYSSSLLA